MTGESERMKVSVFTTMPQGVYSGGRYLSLILAYAMSRAGADVTYVTNNAPLFERDFRLYDQMCPIRTIIAPTFALPDDLVSDWVLVIPTGGFNSRFYNAAIDHAKASGARLALLSFETPNWYADLSPFPRSPMPTESWRQVVASGGLVVTIAQEGIEPARAYFGDGNERMPRRFDYWHPAINDLAAESISGVARTRRSVTMFVRTEDPHKGARDLLRLPPDVFDGHVLSLVFGRGVDEEFVAALRRHFAPARDFAIEVLAQITDEDKFALLSRSRLLLFPSYFEGYGYPPVEAAWMGVPSVAYDLPLLREVAGDAVRAVPPGDTDAFAAAIRQVLAERLPESAVRDMMRVSPDTLTSGQKMLEVLRRAAPLLPVSTGQAPSATVPGGGTGADAHVAQLLSRLAGDVCLFDMSATISAGRVTVTGQIEGAGKGDHLRIDLPNGTMPLVVLEAPGAKGLQRFRCEGQLQRWPSGQNLAKLQLTLQSAGRGTRPIGTVDLTPDWVALLASTAEGGVRQPQDIVVYADPAAIAAQPLMAALLSEVCARAQHMGQRVALLLPRDCAAPTAALAVDLLPLFDAAEVVDAPEEVLMQAHAAGAVILTMRALCPAGLDVAEGLVLDAGSGADDGLILFAPGAGKLGRHAVRPDAVRWGRQGRRLAAAVHAVVLPNGPIDTLGPEERRCLKHLQKIRPGLDFVIPEALCTALQPILIGIGQLDPIEPAKLAALLSQRGSVIGLRLDLPPDTERDPAAIATERLLEAYRLPVLPLTEASTAEVISAGPSRADPEKADSLAQILAQILTPRRHGLSAPADGSLLAATVAGVWLEPPTLKQGSSLGFSATLGDSNPALVSGWTDCTPLGARISEDRGVVAFRVAPGHTPCTQLELMLHLSPAADPGLSVKVVLNGHLLGTLPNLPVGASVQTLLAPEGVWKDGDQVLVLMLVRTSAALPGTKITLIALSPAGKAPPPPVVAPTLGREMRPAPLYSAPIGETSGIVSCGFAKGAPAGSLRLTAGWSAPEAEFTWSSGPMAAMGFYPPLAAEVPLLLGLRGNALSVPAVPVQPAQRMLVRQGSRILAETMVPVGKPDLVHLPMPTLSPASALDTLLFEFPDAVRPSDLGISSDSRLLGLALYSAECRVLPERIAVGTLRADADRAWPVLRTQLAANAPGLLRLVGTGPVPSETRFGLSDGSLIVYPMASPDGGWEVSLVLPAESVRTGRADILCLSGNTRLPTVELGCELWAEPAHRRPVDDVGAEALDITMIATHDEGLAPVAALAQSAGIDLLTPAESRLVLPAEFDFGSESPHLTLLGKGWSHPEQDWVWSAGDAAWVNLPAPIGATLIRLNAGALVFDGLPRQRVRLSTGKLPFATLLLGSHERREVAFILPPEAAPGDALRFGLPDAIIPANLGLSPDTRNLAMRLERLHFGALPQAILQPVEAEMPPEPGILQSAMLPDGGMVVAVGGGGMSPYGLATAVGEDLVLIAHTFAARGGWQALLALPADAVGPERRVTVFIYATSADVDENAPSAALDLLLPEQPEGEA